MEAVAFALAGAVVSVLVGAFANWMARPQWTERHPGRVVALVALLAVTGGLITFFAQEATDTANAAAPEAPASAAPPSGSTGDPAAPETTTPLPGEQAPVAGGSGSGAPAGGGPGAAGGADPPPGRQPATAPVRVATSTLGGVRVGESWTANFAAQGGIAPYRWSVGGGALPRAFVLQPGGEINGTASSPTRSTFTVTVTDTAGVTASKSFTIEPVPRRSDITVDGPVDCADKDVLMAQWNQTGPSLRADINKDEIVNITDLSIMLSDWTGGSQEC